MPENNWSIYQRYKTLNKIEDFSVLKTLEALIRQTDLYDTIEFSHKYAREGTRFLWYPLRFSLWKFKFDNTLHSSFFCKGMACFQEILDGAEGSKAFAAFASVPPEIPETEFRYLSLGIEIDRQMEKSRLKIYAGYKPNDPALNSFLVRSEFNMNGEITLSRYDALIVQDPRTRLRLCDLPDELLSDCFIVIFVEGDRVHCKIDQRFAVKAIQSVSNIIQDADIQQNLNRMLDSGYQLIVMTLNVSEIMKRELNHVTLYFRDQNWRLIRDVVAAKQAHARK